MFPICELLIPFQINRPHIAWFNSNQDICQAKTTKIFVNGLPGVSSIFDRLQPLLINLVNPSQIVESRLYFT